MNELHLFAGIGGGILGGQLSGHKPVCAVEIDEYCRSILVQRQNDGNLPPFPIWDDIRTFDGTRWRGIVDVVCGGFPCQDISSARRNAAGIFGQKSSLWLEMLRVIREVRPRFVFVENSDMLVRRGLDVVLKGLAESGYDACWGVLSAAAVGAPHLRRRLWILAQKQGTDGSYTDGRRSDAITFQERIHTENKLRWGQGFDDLLAACPVWESGVSGFSCMDDELSKELVENSMRGIGNSQVPSCAAIAFNLLFERINGRSVEYKQRVITEGTGYKFLSKAPANVSTGLW